MNVCGTDMQYFRTMENLPANYKKSENTRGPMVAFWATCCLIRMCLKQAAMYLPQQQTPFCYKNHSIRQCTVHWDIAKTTQCINVQLYICICLPSIHPYVYMYTHSYNTVGSIIHLLKYTYLRVYTCFITYALMH